MALYKVMEINLNKRAKHFLKLSAEKVDQKDYVAFV